MANESNPADTKNEILYLELAQKEGWEIKLNKPVRRDDPRYLVVVDGHIFPLAHPYRVHITLYRRSTDPETKFQHMKAAHDYLWPDYALTWNDWEERRFRAHCQDYETIVLASGASGGKSSDAARIGLLFFASAPKEHAVIVASTTLDSLESRIWGYVQYFFTNAALPLPFTLLTGKPPKILASGKKREKIHGMFAVAIPRGEAEKIISTLIGRHPKRGLLFLIDESTEMPPEIMSAIPNLKKGLKVFQLWGIGNSCNKNDLHGALATPRVGWENIRPDRDFIWETTRERGVCLYFNPYTSPAIHETDPIKKAALSRFLPTLESIANDKVTYGDGSEAFCRFTMGFWKSNEDNTVSTMIFMTEHAVFAGAEWSGFYPIDCVAGLDPAFQVGGLGCVLRLAYLGHTTSGLMALDYREEDLLYRIKVNPTNQRSGELQIAEQVLGILARHGCPLHRLCIDSTGPGKPLGEYIRLVSGGGIGPIRISFTGNSKMIMKKKDDPGLITGMPTDFWFKFRDFVQANQIKGLDRITVSQLTSRMLVMDDKSGKHKLETKAMYQARMAAIDPKLAHSPDEADAGVLCLFSAIFGLGFSVGQRREVETAKQQPWQAKLEAHRMMTGNNAKIENVGRRGVVPSFKGSVENFAEHKLVRES